MFFLIAGVFAGNMATPVDNSTIIENSGRSLDHVKAAGVLGSGEDSRYPKTPPPSLPPTAGPPPTTDSTMLYGK